MPSNIINIITENVNKRQQIDLNYSISSAKEIQDQTFS